MTHWTFWLSPSFMVMALLVVTNDTTNGFRYDELKQGDTEGNLSSFYQPLNWTYGWWL